MKLKAAETSVAHNGEKKSKKKEKRRATRFMYRSKCSIVCQMAVLPTNPPPLLTIKFQ